MAGLKVIILAAGKSKRIKSDTPKVLHEVAGKPVLEYVLEQAASLNPEQILCVVSPESSAVRKAFASFPNIQFVEQREALGTGHAVMQARPFLEKYPGDVIVLCGDVPLIRHQTLARFVAEHASAKAAGSVLTARYANPAGYGRIVRDGAGALRQIVEDRDCTPELREIDECNSGTYIFSGPHLLSCLDQLKADNAQGEYYLTDVLQFLLLKNMTVGSTMLEDDQEVVGINTRRDLAVADAIARGWIMLELLERAGVTIVDPATTYIDADVRIGRDTVIRPFSCIRRGVVIGEHCEVGPFAHLRPGTVMDAHTKIGAFVEAKNAHLFSGAKAGHMAYLGDVDIGRDANIGAGTVVANYDGKNKHKTTIHDEAFIGCGTILVAPVEVGRGAITGANTVVPKHKNVPPGMTVVGIPAREIRRKTVES